jgi:hypothetical protein
MHLLVKTGIGYTYYYVVHNKRILVGGVLPCSGNNRIDELFEKVNINVIYTSTTETYIYHKDLCDVRELPFHTTMYTIIKAIKVVFKNHGVTRPNTIVYVNSDGSVLYRDSECELITLDSMEEIPE